MSPSSKLETLSQLHNSGLIGVEEFKRLLGMDTGESMSQNISLGVNGTTHYYAVGDETRCNKCYGNTLVKIGTLHLNGAQQDAHRCTTCNIITSTVDGGIRSLVNEAGSVVGGGSVGFTSASGGALQAQLGIQSNAGYNYNNGSGYANNSAGITFDYSTNSKFDNMNSSLMQLVTEMQNMSKVVKDLAKQNKELMEKLATDPLNGMRKAVNSFNLE